VVIEVITTVSDCIDPKDNVFLALVETAEADLIVFSDPCLTKLRSWHGTPILHASRIRGGHSL